MVLEGLLIPERGGPDYGAPVISGQAVDDRDVDLFARPTEECRCEGGELGGEGGAVEEERIESREGKRVGLPAC